MAGAGYKLFNTGDVLTAAQVNTYLQEQAVMRFASAAARTTALSGVLAEGMVSYLMDTNAVEVYDGSAWIGVATGDITAVTAGTGISGGGTSGAVTITNAMATEITAAGDIIVGTGSGTFDNLPIGTTGQVLTADTTVSPYKVKWATAASGSTFSGCFAGSAGDTIPNATATVTRWNTEVYDTDGYHVNTSPNWTRMTIPTGKSGYFLIQCSIRMAAITSSTTTSYIGLYKNGSLLRRRYPSAYSRENWTISCIESLSAGDYVEIYLYQDSGSSKDTVAGDSQTDAFMIAYLGA